MRSEEKKSDGKFHNGAFLKQSGTSLFFFTTLPAEYVGVDTESLTCQHWVMESRIRAPYAISSSNHRDCRIRDPHASEARTRCDDAKNPDVIRRKIFAEVSVRKREDRNVFGEKLIKLYFRSRRLALWVSLIH